MIKIAIILFPGLNTEYETRREIEKAGMRGEFFKWNDNSSKLKKYDGYVIGGGFSYEDRVRAGTIASQDPLIETLKKETEEPNLKPLMGICNGCQILIETGLIPGAEGYKNCFGMARNKRVLKGEILGTGYYNDWIYLKAACQKGETAFTRLIDEGEILEMPVAHAEGRFVTTVPGLIDRLKRNHQIIFRYCDAKGNILPDFPVNPNGSLHNIAALANPAGNILGLMPHFERSLESQTFFRSMKEYIELKRPKREKKRKLSVSPGTMELKTYAPAQAKKNLFFHIDLKINDNEAETLQATLTRMGFEGLSVTRQTHYEIAHRERRKNFAKKLLQSGILFNTNKETVLETAPETDITADITLLVRDKQDFIGQQKAQTLKARMGFGKIDSVKRGTVWRLRFRTKSENERAKLLKKLLKTNIFANPHAQEVFLLS